MSNLDAIYRARKNVQGLVTRTPLLPAPGLSGDRHEVRLKLETLQPTGAFKLRGAVNAVSRLSREQLERGVVCVSTGNHGRALAYAANRMGGKATICVSRLVPQNKIDAIAALGAEVVVTGESQDEAQQQVEYLVREQGMSEIPPFDHADVIAGQGTMGLEILEDWPEVDTVLAGLSGGGLISGVAIAMKTINPAIRVIGLSPERGAAMAASLDAGKPVEVEELETLADSLGGGIGLENKFTFQHVRGLVDEVLLLSEKQIARGMQSLFTKARQVAEGSGAVGVALLTDPALQGQLSRPLGKRVAVVVSGNNVDMDDFQRVIDGSHPALKGEDS